MTITVIWKEGNLLWCSADSRLVAGCEDSVVTDLVAKIHSIPVLVHAQDEEGFLRSPHYWTQYGFVYAGSAAPASMTAITASTLLQQLARPGSRTNPPCFEEIAELVRKLAQNFMSERRQLGQDGLFWSALFGWCPHSEDWKVALISPHCDSDSFRVELCYPQAPAVDGEPWLVLGTGKQKFQETYSALLVDLAAGQRHVPRLVIEKMIREELDGTVGGSVSTGAAHRNGFLLFHSETVNHWGSAEPIRIFNGLDLDRDVGGVFPYQIVTQALS